MPQTPEQYWKARCEAAEKLLFFYDQFYDPHQFEQWPEFTAIWKELVNTPIPTVGDTVTDCNEIMSEVSTRFYNDMIAHNYKDGKFDYRYVHKWFIDQVDWLRDRLKSRPVINWIPVSERLPENDAQLCLFVTFHQGRIIKGWENTWYNIKAFRKWELENDYTHWVPLPEPPKQNIEPSK